MRVDICIPVYNEEQIVGRNLEQLKDFCRENIKDDWRIIVLDNGSSDSTREIVDSLCDEHTSLFSIEEKGKGIAIKTFFDRSDADILAYMDIDLAVSLDYLPQLIDAIKKNGYDIAMGSRLMKDSETERSAIRSFSSVVFNFLSRQLLNHPFLDMQCGFKAIKKSAFAEVSPFIRDHAWFFDTEMICYAFRKKFRIKELPVAWKENRYEQRKSKINVLWHGMVFFKNLLMLKKRLAEQTITHD